ncbi:MAG: methylenetetrahydrofolate--tRNA-(uracil(54)-C(5))-methyltransferase (FADH(2)-oxidizing) TrmFO [Coriobacteriales bacterium]|jgi:methylenetetrahydrofolate--tRNA-(uracil-5-)-methyltransferase|nr:methylenetetrahydrofolate--tRNA-(uracil(54)-C(5))-methyltransferase (FADH(2)-oxidizing) TrmFO [Coriobacteriales bacterium]
MDTTVSSFGADWAQRGHGLSALVVGAGLAGSEAAWQLAERGVRVRIVEMRPDLMTPAHRTAECAELVCSNSLKSLNPSSAAGCLKTELALLGSFVLRCALDARVAAGGALAVDRARFSRTVTEALMQHPRIELVRAEASDVAELVKNTSVPCVVATGPLTSDAFAKSLARLVGRGFLSFYDAAAPIVEAESLDYRKVFAQSRYDKSGADYLNAPFDKEGYELFWSELVGAERAISRDFERRELFQACQPVEEVARAGIDALRFGALKPVGLRDPATGRRSWAAVQLRAENSARSAYNLVGFQTNLTFGAQERVFRLIPGLAHAEFVRFGVMHRNTFIDSPHVLGPHFELPSCPSLFFAGQITGTEGYAEAIASGLLAALNVYALIIKAPLVRLPDVSVFGALSAYATNPSVEGYQPMHVNYGIMPPLVQRQKSKQQRYESYACRAVTALKCFVAERSDLCFCAPYALPHVEDATT